MIKEICCKYKYLIAFIIGIVNSLPFIFNGLYWISWFSFSFILLFLSSVSLNNKSFYACINIFYFAYYFGAYSFFAALYPLTFAGIGYLASFIILLLAWVGVSLFHSVILSLGTYYSFKTFTRTGAKIISASLLFVLGEYLISVGPLGFPWGRYAVAQYICPYLIQSASVFGPYCVDFILILVNALIALAFLAKKKLKYVLLITVIFLLNLFLGVILASDLQENKADVSVAIVQGNVLSDEKWHGKSSFRTYMDETLTLKNVDLIVWGETAIPTELNKSYSIINEISHYSKQEDTELIVGAFYEDDEGKVYNGAYHVNNAGVSNDIYLKRKLVPFGEFLPFRKILDKVKLLGTINMLSSDLSPGNAPVVTNTIHGKVGSLICFDSVYHTLARESVKSGAEMLAILTNDSWYKDSPAVYLHNGHAVWRAVENGRWVIRSANSGISSFISPNGRIISSIQPLTKGTDVQNVYFTSDTTLYTQIGDLIIAFILFAWIFLSINEYKKGFCRKQKH